jgi:hypothetical protein
VHNGRIRALGPSANIKVPRLAGQSPFLIVTVWLSPLDSGTTTCTSSLRAYFVRRSNHPTRFLRNWIRC